MHYYSYVVQQTHEEKVKMYMKSSKKELIEMLIACNNLLDFANKEIEIQALTSVSEAFLPTDVTTQSNDIPFTLT